MATAQEIDMGFAHTYTPPVPASLTTTYLRLKKEGSTFTGYYSADGQNWIQVEQYTGVNFENLKVGLMAVNAWPYPPEIPADFDFFRVTWPPTPFLDLPVSYSDFAQAAKGNVNDKGPGRVNSWFDHRYPYFTHPVDCYRHPEQGPQHDDRLTNWEGDPSEPPSNLCNCVLGSTCYDGHNGIDFEHDRNLTNESVFAAAPGVVSNTVYSNIGYGNRVWINHNNGYATLYAHLDAISVTVGTVITDTASHPLGVMGDTGNSKGIHLHFGVYYDPDEQWTENDVVDPYGWAGAGYLWKYQLRDQQLVDSSGASLTTPSGSANAIILPGALTSTVTLELWDTPPVAAPSAQLRSTGYSFWLRVLEWLTGGSSSMDVRAASASFAQPITVSVTYGITQTRHLDTTQLIIYHWDETNSTWVALPTTVDTGQSQAMAQATETGHFDLQAPLLCPADSSELDDSYYTAKTIPLDGTAISRLFDIAEDEDWFQLETSQGVTSTVQTSNLAAGVDTVVELYDMDGVTLLTSDDNSGGGAASRLEWRAPLAGTYFLRVVQAPGSAYGCDAAYELSVNQEGGPPIYLPIILKSH